MTTATANCQIRHARANAPSIHHWSGQLSTLFGRTPVDPGHLPAHIQRDLGFLDGNDPRGRHR